MPCMFTSTQPPASGRTETEWGLQAEGRLFGGCKSAYSITDRTSCPTVIAGETRRSQHSQECHDPRRQFFPAGRLRKIHARQNTGDRQGSDAGKTRCC